MQAIHLNRAGNPLQRHKRFQSGDGPDWTQKVTSELKARYDVKSGLDNPRQREQRVVIILSKPFSWDLNQQLAQKGLTIDLPDIHIQRPQAGTMYGTLDIIKLPLIVSHAAIRLLVDEETWETRRKGQPYGAIHPNTPHTV